MGQFVSQLLETVRIEPPKADSHEPAFFTDFQLQRIVDFNPSRNGRLFELDPDRFGSDLNGNISKSLKYIPFPTHWLRQGFPREEGNASFGLHPRVCAFFN